MRRPLWPFASKYGVPMAMVTAGAQGAVLASADGVWQAATAADQRGQRCRFGRLIDRRISLGLAKRV